MKNLFFVILLAFAFGCEDDDGEIVHRSLDARFIDIEAPLEDGGISDADLLDSELPVADGILPSLDAALPVLDLDLVDAELLSVDSGALAADLGIVSEDAGEVVVDASLSDM